MADKPKPKGEIVRDTSLGIRNGQVKERPPIDKTSVLPPPPSKPKS